MIKNLTVGADPELFLKTDEKVISAEGLIGGTKEEPKTEGLEKGYALQEDNVMVEFNIPPCKTSEEFTKAISYMLDNIETIAILNNSKLHIVSSVEFDEEDLQSEQAQEFGCEPDFDAYSFAENPRVEIKDNIRVAGGHIHIGYDNPSEDINLAIVRTLDIFLGLPSIVLDEDQTRKQYYGSAGSYRNKSFGVEYRTLSNFWLKDEKTTKWVFEQVERAMEFINNGGIRKVSPKLWNEIELAINDNDSSLALSLEKSIEELTVKSA